MHLCILKSKHLALREEAVLDGGTWRFYCEIRALLAAGHTAEIWSTDDPTEVPDGITVHHVKSNVGQSTSRRGERDYAHGAHFVASVIRSPSFVLSRFNLVATHHWTSAIGLADMIPSGFPWLHTPHLLAHSRRSRAGDDLPSEALDAECHILRSCSRVVALSAAELSEVRAIHPLCPAVVLANPIDSALVTSESTFRNGRRRIRVLTVARLVHQKGIDILLDVAELCAKLARPYDFTLVAPQIDGDAGPLAEAVSRSRIAMVVRPTRDELRAMFEDADIYFQPSRHETQGIAVLEAMAAGCAVVTTKVAAVAEYIDDTSGVLVDGYDVESFVSAIDRAVVEKKRLGQNARMLADRYSEQRFAESWISIVEQEVAVVVGEASPTTVSAEEVVEIVRSDEPSLTNDIVAVARVGSFETGRTTGGDDQDFAVLHTGSCEEGKQVWRFRNGAMIDCRLFSLNYLSFCSTPLSGSSAPWVGDYLASHRVLWTKAGTDRRDVEAALRAPGSVWPMPARVEYWAHLVADGIDHVRALVNANLLYDAHVQLRISAQDRLIASLVAEGWSVMGSRQRPEIAVNYNTSRPVADALDLVLDVVGVRDMTAKRAHYLTGLRHELRLDIIAMLSSAMKDEPNEMARRLLQHEIDGFDYYTDSIRRGIVRGSVNHMRSLSGVPHYPRRLRDSMMLPMVVGPTTWFAEVWPGPGSIRELFFEVCELTSMPNAIAGWLRRLEELNSRSAADSARA